MRVPVKVPGDGISKTGPKFLKKTDSTQITNIRPLDSPLVRRINNRKQATKQANKQAN